MCVEKFMCKRFSVLSIVVHVLTEKKVLLIGIIWFCIIFFIMLHISLFSLSEWQFGYLDCLSSLFIFHYLYLGRTSSWANAGKQISNFATNDRQLPCCFWGYISGMSGSGWNFTFSSINVYITSNVIFLCPS